MSRAQATTDVFFAIADPTRRRILDLLTPGEQPVLALARQFDVTVSAISQHMRVLREVGLVTVRQEGRERFYRLEPEPLRDIASWIAQYERFWDGKMDALGAYLEEKNDSNVETTKDTEKVTLDRVYPQAPDKVWKALTSRRALERWLLPNDFQPRLGHRFTFRDRNRRIDCEVIALEEGKRLAYTWRRRGRTLSVVSWTLEPVEAGTRVRLRHQPCVNVAASGEVQACAGVSRWPAAVETLGTVLEPLQQVFRAPSMQRGAVRIRTLERRRTRINTY